MNSYIASIDQGTTSTRCLLFDKSAQIISTAQKEHQQIYPQAGWVEHDATEIWENTQYVIKEALKSAHLSAKNIAGIGITNQRETSVLWNKSTGQPYYNAIVWQDTRTQSVCDAIAQKIPTEKVKTITGLPIASYFSGPKITWLLENIAGLEQQIEMGNVLFGTMDTWLIWQLSGGSNGGQHVTDVSNASRTLLMDLQNLNWHEELLTAMHIPKNILPSIRPSSDSAYYGLTKIDGPFAGEIPICGNLGDQQAATVGQTCFNPGDTKNTYGTGCFLIQNTGEQIIHSQHGLLTTVCYQFDQQATVYALEGSVAIAGALIQWLRDNLGIINNASEVEQLANTVEDNGDVYFVPAFSGLYAPYWRQDARGIIIGLTRFNNKGHIARAALEACAYQTRDIVDAMQMDSDKKLSTLKVDGGTINNNLLMQFQADVLDLPVTRPHIAEITALGAAYAAGLAVNFWQSTEELTHNHQTMKTWQPAENKLTKNQKYQRWQEAVKHSFDWKH